MSGAGPGGVDRDPPSAREREQERVVAALDRYEAAWRAGQGPRIEDHLAGAPDPERPGLFRELLELELELRRGRGERPDPGEYRARFPGQESAIEAAFRAAERPTPWTTPTERPVPSDPTGPGDETTAAVRSGPDEPNLEPGTRIRYFGDYELLRELGRGGMGVVYRARQVSLNRPVAVKMIKAGVLADDAELRRFQNEAEAVALLDHPGIVPVYEVGEHDGQRYFSMKLIDGNNLAEQLESFKDNPRAAVTLLTETVDAVQHAHMRGILHRDLKPANILVGAQGHPHITDFGLAKLVESDVELTASGAIMGTPAYMSPEQAAGRRGAMTLATDVYGLGAILYALLTGRAPFGGDSVIETLDAVRTRPPQPLTRRNAKIPRDLELICLKCLEKNPADRYPTAGALADDLRHWMAGEPVSVRAAGAVERVAKWARRKPTLAAAYSLGLLALLLGGLGGAAVWQWRVAAKARDGQAKARASAERARDGEKTARAVAERARDGEKVARAAAERALDGEAKARATLARVEYGRTMDVALQEWQDGYPAATRSLLESTRSDLRGWEWRYVQRLSHADLLTLKGHTGSVSSASFSPDGTRIVTASTDRTAKVWDAQSGAELLTLKGHTGSLRSASFSPDGSRIVTGSYFATPSVWNAQTGALVLTLKGLLGPVVIVHSASFSPDGSRILAATQHGKAKVWDARSGAEIPIPIEAETGFVSSLSSSFSPDGSRIMTMGSKAVRIWDARSGAEVLTIKCPSSFFNSAQFSPDGSRVVTADWDNTATEWDSRSGAEVLTLKGHFSSVSTASFSPDGSRIVTSSQDGTARIWDSQSGAELVTLKGHSDFVTSASFSPDGSRVVTGSRDGTAKVWSVHCPGDVVTLQGRSGRLNSASFSPDGSWLVTCGDNGTARIWESRGGAEALTLSVDPNMRGPVNGIHQVASYSPAPGAPGRVVTGNYDGTVKVWDAMRGIEVLRFRAHRRGVSSVSFSPDGLRIVTGSFDMTAKVWDAQTGAQLLTLNGHRRRVSSASFSPDGSRIVTAGPDGVKVWDAHSGGELLTIKPQINEVVPAEGEMFFASFSPDGSRVVTAIGENTAKVWNSQSGAEVLTLRGHSRQLSSVSFSPDGSRIITGSLDGTAKIWDAETGAQLLTLKGHVFSVSSASFSPDGSRIVTCGPDGTARVWDSAPSKESKPVLRDAQRAYDQRNFSTAARLWAEALAGDAAPQEDGWNAFLGKSARAAALAAAGQGGDAAGLDNATKAKLRRQALDGLDAELRSWTRHLESTTPEARVALVKALAQWRVDEGLACVRDAAALAKLPAEEQKEWRALWARVPGLSRGVPTWLEERQTWSYAANPLAEGGQKPLEVRPQRKRFGINYLVTEAEARELEQTVVALGREIEGKPRDGGRYLHYGRLLGDLGRHDEAIEAFRKALELNPTDGGAHYNLGDSLAAQGRLNDALAAFREAQRLAPALTQSRDRRLLYLAACAAARAAAGQGTDVPAPDDAAKVKLRQEALDGLRAEYNAWRQLDGPRAPQSIANELQQWKQDPDLASIRDDAALAGLPEAERKQWQALWNDVDSLHDKAIEALLPRSGSFQRHLDYHAACAAARAAAGVGKDVPPPVAAAMAKLRRHALGGMRAEYEAWDQLLESGAPQAGTLIAHTLKQWKQDPDLASVRDAIPLSELSEHERKELQTFWADVEALLKRAQAQPTASR
jgi:WD40 repeat protein/tetratricopeptide (TPR) repeat protein